jgi:hypothetical protein
MAEVEAAKEWELLQISDEVQVCEKCTWDGSFLLPKEEGDIEVRAVFKTMTHGDYKEIEMACRCEIEQPKGPPLVQMDYEVSRKLILQRMLLRWNLDMELEHDERTGWLTDECLERVCRLPAPLVTALMCQYENTLGITADEEKLIDRQAAILFAKNSKGVKNACEAVSLYCTSSGFWDKFGLNRFDLNGLPQREFIMMRIMLSKDNEAQTRQMNEANRPVSNTRIAGPGGKSRPSRAVVVG